jgi:hypothetical protein
MKMPTRFFSVSEGLLQPSQWRPFGTPWWQRGTGTPGPGTPGFCQSTCAVANIDCVTGCEAGTAGADTPACVAACAAAKAQCDSRCR